MNDQDGFEKVPQEIVIERVPSKNGPSNGNQLECQKIMPASVSMDAKASNGVATHDVDINSNKSATAASAAADASSCLEPFRNKNFAEKLHALLSVPAYSSTLRWNSTGDAFAIYDTEEFVNTIMATHFQSSKFESFQRRLRRWGFRRMEGMEEKMKGLIVFRCPYFRRDKPDLCKKMCDDRHQKSRKAKENSRRLAAPAYSSDSSGRHRVARHKEPVPIHFPTGHPEHSHFKHNWNPMATAPFPSSVPHPSHLHLPMEMNQHPYFKSHHPPYPWHNMVGDMSPMHYQRMLNHQRSMNMPLPYPHQYNGGTVSHPGIRPPTGQFPEEQMQHNAYNQGLVHNVDDRDPEMGQNSRLKEPEQKSDSEAEQS
mmetsp:Transcript_25925/g.55165  ORF Transcript_25925/g.55165 Transcript_25925/m.55165 type:complete len:369 (+) Transcript_25925:191-1297(+)